MTVPPAPDLADVFAARQRIAPYLRPTPLYRYPALDAMTGAQAFYETLGLPPRPSKIFYRVEDTGGGSQIPG